MATRRKEPNTTPSSRNASPAQGRGSERSSVSEGKGRSRRSPDLSDLDAPTNAFPIGVGLRGRKGSSRSSPPSHPVIEWHDDTDDNPINNDIDDLSEDDLLEDLPQGKRIVIPAWMLVVWLSCAVVLFGLLIAAVVAALFY